MKCKVLSVCPYLYLTLMGHTSVITIKLAFITFSNFENIPNESRIIDEINLQNRAWQKSGIIAKMTNKLMYHILYSLNCLKTWCPRVFWYGKFDYEVNHMIWEVCMTLMIQIWVLETPWSHTNIAHWELQKWRLGTLARRFMHDSLPCLFQSIFSHFSQADPLITEKG